MKGERGREGAVRLAAGAAQRQSEAAGAAAVGGHLHRAQRRRHSRCLSFKVIAREQRR